LRDIATWRLGVEKAGGVMRRWLSREGIGASLVILAVAALLLAWAAPNDVTLAGTSKVVYIHGALVWTSLLMLTAAGVVGLAAMAAMFIKRDNRLHAWTLALGRTGLLFWAAYIPISMLASQMAWNAVFLAEPRYTTSFRVLAIGIIVQVIILLVNCPVISSALHVAQAVILWALLLTTPSILHPDSPILRSAPSIQFFFGLIVLACGVAALQVARLISGLASSARIPK
jgi:hypothetical protein